MTDACVALRLTGEQNAPGVLTVNRCMIYKELQRLKRQLEIETEILGR